MPRSRRARRSLNFSVLKPLLAAYAVGGPGEGLEALDANSIPTVQAFTESAVRKAGKGSANQIELCVSIGALTKEQLFLIGGNSLVSHILGVVGAGLAALFYGRKHGILQFCLLVKQLFL